MRRRPPSNVRSRSMPRLFDAHYYYARFLVTRGDHAGAARHFEAAFAIQPGRLPAGDPDDPGIPGARRPGRRAARNPAFLGGYRATPRDRPGRLCGLRPRAGRAGAARTPGGIAPILERAVALRPEDPKHPLQRRLHGALSGDYESALDLLERAVSLGWSNAQWLLNDDDFAPMREHPRFQQLLARLA